MSPLSDFCSILILIKMSLIMNGTYLHLIMTHLARNENANVTFAIITSMLTLQRLEFVYSYHHCDEKIASGIMSNLKCHCNIRPYTFFRH